MEPPKVSTNFHNRRRRSNAKYLSYLFEISINHSQLQSFHAVAAEGGFTAGSRLRNVAQPVESPTPLCGGRQSPEATTILVIALVSRMVPGVPFHEALTIGRPRITLVSRWIGISLSRYLARGVVAMQKQYEPSILSGPDQVSAWVVAIGVVGLLLLISFAAGRGVAHLQLQNSF